VKIAGDAKKGGRQLRMYARFSPQRKKKFEKNSSGVNCESERVGSFAGSPRHDGRQPLRLCSFMGTGREPK
jgi:protein involved in temperature-dependent protein secretion